MRVFLEYLLIVAGGGLVFYYAAQCLSFLMGVG